MGGCLYDPCSDIGNIFIPVRIANQLRGPTGWLHQPDQQLIKQSVFWVIPGCFLGPVTPGPSGHRELCRQLFLRSWDVAGELDIDAWKLSKNTPFKRFSVRHEESPFIT